MTAPSDVLDRLGFRRVEVMPLLQVAGICADGVVLPEVKPQQAWPDWKRRLAVLDELTHREAAGALAGVDLSTPYYLSDEEQADYLDWTNKVMRACRAGTLHAACTEENEDGTPSAWGIALPDLAVWCASRTPPIPYPLPGDPALSTPTTDVGLREALATSERERAEWKDKAAALEEAQQQSAALRVEVDRLRQELRSRADEVAALTAEVKRLRSDALAGKGRSTALKIVGGLAMGAYRMSIHAERLDRLGEMVADLENAGAAVNEKTLRTWLKEAARIIEPSRSKER